MRIIRFSLLAVILVATTVLLSRPVLAWEFRMQGSFFWNYYAASQMGHNGFFGTYDSDAAGAGFGQLNFWAGENRWPGAFGGATASLNTQFMEINPEIRLNKAVRLRGTYYLGDFGTPVLSAAEYRNSTALGALNPMWIGTWTKFWATAQTPWGIVGLGKRALEFGLAGKSVGVRDDASTAEALLLAVPHGPMRVGILFYPSRDLAYPNISDPEAIGTGAEDGNNKRNPEIGAFITYGAGPIAVGYFQEVLRWHKGPESQSPQNPNFVPRDFFMTDGLVFVKYNNGRFFFNAQYGFFKGTVRNSRSLSGLDQNSGAPFVNGIPGAGSVFQSTYTDCDRVVVELGAFGGPAKVSLFWAWASGPDRRHGVLIDRQGHALWLAPRNGPIGMPGDDNSLLTLHPNLSNAGIFFPYSYLLVFNYGTGGNYFNIQGDGQVNDANILATRLDYAAAANLNLWTSFLWADRISHGYGWGFISPGAGGSTYARQGDFNNPSPAIPDAHLGWEWNVGLEWQLLEGFLLSTRFAYWQPGAWFKYACVSRKNPGWQAPGPGNGFGIDPDRVIDPVVALEVNMGFDF
jgi:hypothetical protein